jgi:hypothetical protein
MQTQINCEPYFDLSFFGEDWQGQVYDTFSLDLRGVSEESSTATENGTSLSAHGAQVAAPSGRPRWWGQFVICNLFHRVCYDPPLCEKGGCQKHSDHPYT